MKEQNGMTELALYIDIEGFGCKFENGGRKSFIDLTNDLYLLGRNYFNKIFIYQFGGDGFLIKEVQGNNSVSYFIDISAALLQMITIRGGAGRVQISHGYMSDISDLYSDEIKKEIQANNQNILGDSRHNKMYINHQVIGTSIINCHKLKGPKGPLLLVDKDLEEEMKKEKGYVTIPSEKFEVINVNWVKHRNENTKCILKCLNLNSDNIENKLRTYIDNNDLSEEWKRYAMKLME